MGPKAAWLFAPSSTTHSGAFAGHHDLQAHQGEGWAPCAFCHEGRTPSSNSHVTNSKPEVVTLTQDLKDKQPHHVTPFPIPL